jgi:hypothetical protein
MSEGLPTRGQEQRAGFERPCMSVEGVAVVQRTLERKYWVLQAILHEPGLPWARRAERSTDHSRRAR